MKSTIFASWALIAAARLAAAAPQLETVTVSYDTTYDDSGSSLTSVTCSDGDNGLIKKGYTTFGSLPSFPLIGGAPTIVGSDSPNCGKCYELHYQSGETNKTISVLAIDTAQSRFNIARQAMDALTDGQAVQLGSVKATYVEVDGKLCGL